MQIVLCNAPPDHADTIARAVVAEGLAACVNLVGPVRSIYRWQGEICDELEVTLWIKTARPEALAERLRALHPYDTPEILVVPVDVERSDPRYVAWVVANSTESA